jgi:hypothetical protein
MRVSLATVAAVPGRDNEDFAAATADAAVLVDGAGLSGTSTRCRHGVAWYSRTLGATLFRRVIDDARDLRAVLAEAIAETANAHGNACDLRDPGTPSATVIVVRLMPEAVQYLVLADSVLVVSPREGDAFGVTDDREALVGRRYRGVMDQAANGTAEHEQARQDYVQAMRQHRNRPDGFWVAAADPAAAEEALTGVLPRADLHAVALLSDGASRLVDRFGLDTWDGLMATLASGGPNELLRLVRAAENSDLAGRRWPRGKTHDDATAVYLPFDRFS